MINVRHCCVVLSLHHQHQHFQIVDDFFSINLHYYLPASEYINYYYHYHYYQHETLKKSSINIL